MSLRHVTEETVNNFFEKNLNSLYKSNPMAHSLVLRESPFAGKYQFLTSRAGMTVPAIIDGTGKSHPLHSMYDPQKEGERLVLSNEAGFMVFLGLGGGYAVEAALGTKAARALVIEFGAGGIAELFSGMDYSKLLENPDFTLVVDPCYEDIKALIEREYLPALYGGIRTVPLLSRIAHDRDKFETASAAIKEAVENVSADYSVQAHFGRRWFSNIIRNIYAMDRARPGAERPADKQAQPIPAIDEAAVCGAGPSLDIQIEEISAFKERGAFIISADTAFPALQKKGINADAVMSIDCQHFSCYHFSGCSVQNTPLFLDIASPPPLARLSEKPFFFCGGHPLSVYASGFFPLPVIDVSGGNVAYACLSLAAALGARRITLFGCDFSYPMGRTYAKGTYVYPFFENKQNRVKPLEAQHSAFLYRSAFLEEGGETKRYETGVMRSYRKKLEEKAESVPAEIIAAKGLGVPLKLPKKNGAGCYSFCAEKAGTNGMAFLVKYRQDIDSMPPVLEKTLFNYFQNLEGTEKQIFTTMLPALAALKHANRDIKGAEIFGVIKRQCIDEIGKVLRDS
jgi:hypothetical protein